MLLYSGREQTLYAETTSQVPGKKNLVLQKDLVGPVEALVKFSTLQEYGVDRIFFLENDNVDGSQQNVIFIAGGEKGKQAHSIAGTSLKCCFQVFASS